MTDTARDVTALPCPCCGRPIEGAVSLDDIPMSPVRRTIIRALPATIEQIASAVYGSRDTGATNQYQTLMATMTHLRRILEPYGWSIDARRPGRGNVKTYRLIRLP